MNSDVAVQADVGCHYFVYDILTFFLLPYEMCLPDTDNPPYTDTRYNDKIRYNDNLTVTKPSLKR